MWPCLRDSMGCALLAIALLSPLRANAARDDLPAGARPALRELSTDRPDTTESPFTVDAGHAQIETDAAVYTRNRLDGVKTTEWALAPFNVRYGLTAATEIGIFFTPHVRITEQPRGEPKQTWRGVGDLVLRGKWNFWGNEGGPTAFGMMADVKLPTAADGIGNGKVEGALTLPLAFDVGAGWEGAGMTSVEFISNDQARRRAVWINTITVGRELVPDVGMFLELTSAAGDGAHVATFNCGLTRKLSATLQLDCGANFGISRTAPDLAFFVGGSRKF